MSKGYQRADSLAEILAKREAKKRQSSTEKCQEIVRSPKYGSLTFPYQFKRTGNKEEVIEEKDLRKEILGQLEIEKRPNQIIL